MGLGLAFTPGFYAKIRIDDEGNIVDVAELESQDLPQHSHKVSDISNLQSFLEDRISEILSTFFANNGSSAVVFTYDKRTRTVTADVNIDDETVSKNEFGQLISAAGSGTVIPPTVVPPRNERFEQQLKNLEERIPDILKDLLSKTFASSKSTAVDFSWDKDTGTVSADVNIDGISISRDENGDLIATGAAAGSGEEGNCASHLHNVSQIEDFEDAVINIFKEYSKNIDIDFNNYIDGVTIKINEFGQLTAVRTALEKHTHHLADIVDYEAAEAAAKQAMSALGEDVDLSDGVIDFTNLNIGYSILALNKYLQDVVNKSIFNLTQKVNNLSVEKDNNGQAILSVSQDTIKNNLYDKQDKIVREVYLTKNLSLTLDFLPYTTGKIRLIKDGQLIESQNIESLSTTNRAAGRFLVANAYTKNGFVAKIIKIDISNIANTVDTFQVQFETDRGLDNTNTVQIYSISTEDLDYTFEDLTAKHKILDKEYYDHPVQYKYKISIKNFAKYRFINPSAGFDPATGTLFGTVENSKILSLPSLFKVDDINLDFKLTEEFTDSPLKSILKIEKGAVCNNILIPLEENSLDAYIATFDILGSESFNALKIVITDPAFEIGSAKLLKAGKVAHGTLEATNTSPGFVKLSDNTFILTFGNSYDSGKDLMQLQISTFKKLSLNRMQFYPVDFY